MDGEEAQQPQAEQQKSDETESSKPEEQVPTQEETAEDQKPQEQSTEEQKVEKSKTDEEPKVEEKQEAEQSKSDDTNPNKESTESINDQKTEESEATPLEQKNDEPKQSEEQAKVEENPQETEGQSSEAKPSEGQTAETKPDETEQKVEAPTEAQVPTETLAEGQAPAEADAPTEAKTEVSAEGQAPTEAQGEAQVEAQAPTKAQENSDKDAAGGNAKHEGEETQQQEQQAEQKADEKQEGEEKVEGQEQQQQQVTAEGATSTNATENKGDTDETDAAIKKEGGEDGEEGEEQAPTKEEEPKIPDDFYYDYEQFASKPYITPESGLPEDMLTLQHSFGYDCTKRANLHLLDEKTVLFAAGNFVQILDLQTKEQTFIRSTSGGGVGAIRVHPSRKYFAVAEKGKGPNINIFEYPSLKLYRVLRGGTEKSYSFVDFNPDGSLLASQGSDPDFMLTVWDWKQEKTVLRSKAFSQEVFRATFSTELEGQLTTSGTVHIKFWKMADTFTGLKLQGELGKFGRTEITDIEGYVELPDGKVLSGSEWGNMLLWDGGLIKVEIQRKNKKSCHTGPIQQILLDEGELMSVGIDGYIRVWDFEAIDTADSTDESAVFELDPMNELKVGNDVQLKTIIKSVDTENEPTIWYAQDAFGGIWRLDLSFSHTSMAPEKLFTYHAGVITGADICPSSQLAATTGVDRTVRVFDYAQQKQICDIKYTTGGSNMMWAPKIIDPKGGTIYVGFEDGVLRVLNVSKMDEESLHRKKHHECSLQLLQALKPHSQHITAMAVDSRGEVLATGSSDSTIFFIDITKNYEPMGFMKIPAKVCQLTWSPDRFEKTFLLAFCEEGVVLEIEFPDDAKFDTAHSFEIKGLTIRSYKFGSIKSRLRHEEELERKAKEEEERKKKEEKERKMRIERGLETESEQGDQEEEEKPPEPEWHAYIPEVPSPILTGLYSDPGQFWLSMGDFDAGYLYECKFGSNAQKAITAEDILVTEEPMKSIAVLESDDVPICTIKFSSNGQQALFGMQNGQVRIQTLLIPFDMSEMGPFYCMSVHDSTYGHITSILQSPDATTLITTGADGNFFMFKMMGQEQMDQKIAENKAKLPSAKKLDEAHLPDDIEDPKAYSIEEAKQKAEHDKMMKEAEEKKREVRRHVAKMRRMFKQLLEQNDTLPGHLRLHKDEFEMDREIKEELEKHKQEKIQLVRKELGWESEKQRIALEKLKKRFKDVVECDRIVVKAFKSPHEVASFRASKLSDDFYQLKAEFGKRMKSMCRDDLTRDPTRDILTVLEAQECYIEEKHEPEIQTNCEQSQLSLKEESENDEYTDTSSLTMASSGGATRMTETTAQTGDKADDASGAKFTTTLKGSMGERITKALYKVEEKKKRRAERRAQWEELYATKPDDDYEDPADLSAIKQAKDNMGDYKLKTAKDYVVPDHLRMNVDKARGRLLILQDLIHENKYSFNQILSALRDKKIRIIEEIKDLTTDLERVQSKLAPEDVKPIPPVPTMHPDEMPEKKIEYTRETLIKFKQEMEEKASAKPEGQDGGGGFGGFGGFGGGGDKKNERTASPSMTQKQSTSISTLKQTEDTFALPDGEETELSPLELKMKQAETIRLLFQQENLLKKINDLVEGFDAELRLLRHDKFKLDITMKNADLRQVTLFEELVLLKEYEKREDVLAEKVENKQQEKLDMQTKIIDVQSKIELKKKEIEKLQEKEKALNAQFQQSLGENNKFADYLTKVFKKRIKRTKKKQTEGDDDDDDSDEESDDDSDWDEDEDDEESEMGGYDLDICPPGCDQNLYEATCQLREKRLDIEEDLAEEKKTSENLKKEYEGFLKKQKVIESGLKGAQQDLEAFQLEKQQKLNELDVVVSLKLHQIQYIMNGTLPQDLTNTLVFESTGVTRLQQRIKELEHEKHSQKKYMRESKKTHVNLIKDRRTYESKITEMEKECEEMMVSKFGCVVDIEKLETVTVNRNIEELKEKLRMTEIQCSEEVVEWNERLAEKKTMITDMIRENTKRLNQLSYLLQNKGGSEGALDSRQKNLGEEYSGARKADIRERQRLIQLVQLQAQEIDALKEEIMLLSRKGGHILPPAQPPLPQSPQMRTLSN